MTKSEWEEGRDKTVLAKANIMYKGSDAREYGTHSKAGWHVIELEKKKKKPWAWEMVVLLRKGETGVAEETWRVLHHWLLAQWLLNKYVQIEYIHGWMKYYGQIWKS